jgi:hypothetical protein
MCGITDYNMDMEAGLHVLFCKKRCNEKTGTI